MSGTEATPQHETDAGQNFNFTGLPRALRIYILRSAFAAPTPKLVLFLKDWRDLYEDFQKRWSEIARLADVALLRRNKSFADGVAEAGSRALHTLFQDAFRARMVFTDPVNMLMDHRHFNPRVMLLWMSNIEKAPITMNICHWFERFFQKLSNLENIEPGLKRPAVIIRYSDEQERLAFAAKEGTSKIDSSSCLRGRQSLC